MGGRSSSKSSSTTNTDNRQLAVQDGIGLFSEGDANVTVSDYGAIDRSFAANENAVNRSLDTVDRSLDSVDRTTGGAFDFGKRLQDEVSGTTRAAFDLVNRSYQGLQNLASSSVRGDSGEVADTSKTLIYGLSAVGVVIGLYMIVRSSK